MSQEFYTLLTEVGAAQLANAIATKTPLRLTEIAVGDGGGSPVTPSESQVSLINEVWRGQINQITDYENNQNWLAISIVIPQSEGGFYVREAGIFDENGHLFAVASYPETYKPALSHGSALDLHVRLVLQISNTDAIRIEIDPSVILCTRAELLEHDGDPHSHALITKQVRYQDETVLSENWDPNDETQLYRSIITIAKQNEAILIHIMTRQIRQHHQIILLETR